MNGPKAALVPHQIPRKYATAPVSVSPSSDHLNMPPTGLMVRMKGFLRPKKRQGIFQPLIRHTREQ